MVLLIAFEIAVMFWNLATLILIVIVGPAFVMLTVSSFAIIIFRELEKVPGTVAETDETESSKRDEADS